MCVLEGFNDQLCDFGCKLDHCLTLTHTNTHTHTPTTTTTTTTTTMGCNTLHISFYNIVVQDAISKSPVTATIDAPCSLHRCQVCEPMPQGKLPTIDFGPCPPHMMYQFREPIPRNWCTLAVSRSLIDWVCIRTYMESQIWYIYIQSHV